MDLNFNIKTLRDTLTFNYPIYSDYKKVLPYTDLPYNFDQKKKPWWRWYCYASGSYYSRIHVNYSLWYNNHFKKKIGIYMPIVWKMPHKREKSYGPWIKKYYIYENSYINKEKNWINPKNIYNYNNLNYNFFNYDYYRSNVITNYAHWGYHPTLRSYKSSFYVGSENEMFVSGYNYRWNNLSFRDSLYNDSLTNFNYAIPVNYFSMYGSFYLNSYDSSIILHPHSFFHYYTKKYINRANIINNISNYSNNNNVNLNNNILNSYYCYLKKYIYGTIYEFYKKCKDNKFNLYKLNLLSLHFLNSKKNIIIKYKNLMKILNYNLIFSLNTEKINMKNKYKKIYYNSLYKSEYFIKILNNKNLLFLKNKNTNFYFLNSFLKTKKYIKSYFLYYKNSYNIRNNEFLNKNKIIKRLLYFIKKLKKNKLQNYNDFILSLNKLVLNGEKLNYKKYLILNKENIFHNLKIRKFKLYPKIFVRVNDQFKYLYDKATIVLDQPTNYNIFLWSKYSQDYILNLKNFLYNFFFILIDIFKINFGYFYNLNLYDKKNKEDMDLSFSFEIQLYLFKFFNLFKRKFLKNYINMFFLNKKKDIKFNNFLKKIIKFNIFFKKKDKLYINKL